MYSKDALGPGSWTLIDTAVYKTKPNHRESPGSLQSWPIGSYGTTGTELNVILLVGSMQSSTQVSPNQATQQLFMNGQGLCKSLVVQTTAALLAQKQQNSKGTWARPWYSGVRRGAVLAETTVLKMTGEQTLLLLALNKYSYPLTSCPRTGKTFAKTC